MERALYFPPALARQGLLWWARGGSNPGPPPCEGGVITRLDHGPIPGIVGGSKNIKVSLDLAQDFLGGTGKLHQILRLDDV